MKLASWKEDFDGRLDYWGIIYVEVSKHSVEHEEEECLMWGDYVASISLTVGWMKDGTFSLDKGWTVAKVFIGKKE